MLILSLLIIATCQRALASSDACSRSVTIFGQNDANNLSSCDSLQGSITISPSASGVITINNIEEIKGGFIATGASELTQILLPDLESVKGAITLNNLDSLTTITMGSLQQVASLAITGNQNLKYVEFQELEKVSGQLELMGSFDSVSLPSLEQVKGRTIITSSGSMSCGTFNSLRSDGVFKGGYSCSAGSTGLSPGAKGGIAAGVILGVLFIVTILWFFLRRRRQRHEKGAPSTSPTSSTPSHITVKEEKSSVSHGSNSLQGSVSASGDSQKTLPRKQVGSAVFLDSRSIYEAPNASTPIQEYYELDAGPILSSHQRPINAN